MKTVLIATDFSEASRNAALYGIHFAKAINANIILFNAYEVPVPAAGLNVRVSRYDVMMQTDKALSIEANFLDPNRNKIEIMCDEGPAEDAILRIAKEEGADYIIMGMKGKGKNLKRIFGSTATSLAKCTNQPLIIVPEEAKYTTPGIIVFASDSKIDDQKLPEQLVETIRSFDSKLYIVNVLRSKKELWSSIPDAAGQIKKAVQIINTSYQYPIDADISHALNEFIEKHQADLLVMIPHSRSWTERIFRRSETKDMIFHSKIPLLVLPEPMPVLRQLISRLTSRKIITPADNGK